MASGQIPNSEGTPPADAAGLAALSMCEALAVALVRDGRLTREEVCGALTKALAAHQETMAASPEPLVHQEAASFVERVRDKVDATVPVERAKNDGLGPDLNQHYTVGLHAPDAPGHITVEAEDALGAAVKAKRSHPDATITYARRANMRGDKRHPAPPLEKSRSSAKPPG